MNRNKDRLYLALNHRHDQPGYHWSLLYAPKDLDKDEEDTKDVNNAVRWDLTNEIQGQHRRGIGPWRVRRADVNQYRSISLVARIMLAKFKPKDRDKNLARLTELLTGVPFTQQPDQTCRVWILDAIEVLQMHKEVELKLEDRATIEEAARGFADEQMQAMSTGALRVDGTADIPVLDLRKV